jgi:hypothetical protein
MRKFALLGCLILLAFLIYLRDTPLSIANFPAQECAAFKGWLTNKTKTPPELKKILPPPENPNFFGGGSDGDVTWAGVAKDILEWAGWPSTRMQFASFRSTTYNQLINSPSLQTGTFLIVIPGPSDIKINRRKPNEPWITASPTDLADALPLKSLEILAIALESLPRRVDTLKSQVDNFTTDGLDYGDSNRGLHRFHIEIAPNPYAFPLCRGRGGACAIWEGSTGRIILDADIAGRIISSSTVATLLDKFTLSFANILNNDDKNAFLEESSSSSFSVQSIGEFVAKAATAAISSVLLLSRNGNTNFGRQPLWWCLTCPIVLGLLAPFVINFGLTSAAEQLCASLELPAGECSDLWWAAFALAMVLSLGSAVPIVYVCRLPDCIKRALQ